MKFLTILSLITISLATPIPVNVDLKASKSISYGSVSETPTFSTILPTYTPTQPTFKQTEEVKILFNNLEEISKAEDLAKSTTINLPVAQSSTASAEVPEYRF